MSRIHIEHLQAGYIFGDAHNEEYLYLPAGEVGADSPLCVLERKGVTSDISLEDAGHVIDRLTLKPITHPLLGRKSF